MSKKKRMVSMLYKSYFKIVTVVISFLFLGCNTDESKKSEIEYLFWNASLKTENSFIKEAVKDITKVNGESLILERYNSAETREDVIDFFQTYTKNREIAESILKYSAKYDVPPSLSFALSYNESSFNPKAINKNRKTIDRGLFQLNSSSFPHLSEDQYFDIDTNSEHGIRYIRWCLDTGKNEVSALAMYNAGLGRVSTGGTPRMTLDYISKVLDYRSLLLSDFNLAMNSLFRIDTKNSKLVKDLTKPLDRR